MHKTFYLALLLCTGTSLIAQDDLEVSPWKFGVQASADYCGYQFYYDGQPQEGMWFSEEAKFGWSAGLHAAYDINAHLGVIAGLRFTDHHTGIPWTTLMDASGNTYGEFRFSYHMRYIDVPLGLQYNTPADGDVQFIVNVGVTPGIALGEWVTLDFEGSDTLGITDSKHKSDIDNFRTFSLKAELGMGVGISLTDVVQLQVLPVGRINLLKATSGSYIDRRYWSAGLEMRVIRRF